MTYVEARTALTHKLAVLRTAKAAHWPSSTEAITLSAEIKVVEATIDALHEETVPRVRLVS